MKKPINPMQLAPRCGAKSKRSGLKCQSPAVKGKRVCRMHGAKAGAPSGIANGNWRHGATEKPFTEMMDVLRKVQRHCRPI
ncbi:HGGxSTG domain-containing protein [Rhizobium sp. TH2]|uniref:HGGxSTG domain-containing protein n=1 Tax=Rhizobium sp. TH2 TaxID=2775403 RepID=UPI00280BA610|nr:HGGxSTG domain-containing protein [Rhizobium sp. TH2]